jgi:hypothetical protein
MPDKPYSHIFEGPWDRAQVRCIKWEGLANGDRGEAYVLPHFSCRSVQVAGTPGVGGKVQIKGSNITDQDDPLFDVLSDSRNGLLEFSASGPLRQVVEICHAVRPEVVAGDVDTRFDVYLYLKNT